MASSKKKKTCLPHHSVFQKNGQLRNTCLYFFCAADIILVLSCFPNFTPGIYAEGYIVFVFPFVCSYVRMFVRLFVRSFVRTSFRRVEFASKFCVKVSQVVYISATTDQKAFIFGP